MKKTYIAPCMVIVKIQTVGMIAASMQLNNETVGTSSALSRGNGSLWDDDDEDY